MKKFRLLKADEIECRVAQIKANGLSLLLYKDARCDMNILDETVGAMNWKNEYSRDNRNCTVSIRDDNGEWISKENTGTESNTESEKGLASDSFKRACVNWGIGRELYTAPFIWVRSDSCNIEVKRDKYVCYDDFVVTEIGYDEAERICSLTIVNDKTGAVVYKLNQKAQAAVEEKYIDELKVKALQKMFDTDGIDPKYVCRKYNVESLDRLTEKMHRNIIRFYNKLKAAYVKDTGGDRK